MTDRYWPVLVYWRRGELSASLLADVAGVLREDHRAHIVVACDAQTVALVLAQDAVGAAAGARGVEAVELLVERVVELVRARHRARPHAIVAEASVPAAEVAAQTKRLLRSRRYVESRPAAAKREVVSDRSLTLARLLEGVDRQRAADFVARHVGALLAYDRVHATNLAGLLEIGLDAPNRDDAARAAYMHRNTFRRHLHHAQELIDLDLDDDDQRLAVHVALRLTHVLDLEQSLPSASPLGATIRDRPLSMA